VCWLAAWDTLPTCAAKLGLGQQREVCEGGAIHLHARWDLVAQEETLPQAYQYKQLAQGLNSSLSLP